MKNFKRVLATLLMLVMLMQPFATAASVTEFLDFPNDWSTEAMTAAVENGLLIGNGNRLIEPNRNLRRSELAAIITRAFGATITADIGHFDDVKPGEWYYNAVSEALQMGAMSGTSPSTFHPDKSVTREEVFTTLARVLCIEGTDVSVVDRFSDKGEISDWALASVIGLVENGYIDGYPNGTLDPRGDMTRAELAQMFHNLFKTYIDTAGYHSHVNAEGSVIVRAPGAHLENVTINGDLIIADGVGAGDFDLNSVTVNGRILARGGEGKVTFKKVTAAENVVIFDRNGVVNFNNYRTDVPFKDNLVEHTPATFLTKKPVNTGTGSSRPSGGDHTTRYNVYFYFDGRIFDSVSVKEGNPVSAPTRTPSKNGYTFVYWSDDKDDDGTGTGFDFTTPITASTRLYAIFTKDAVEYDITFDFGNGTTKVVTIVEGEKINEADVPVMSDTDTQNFKGWTATYDDGSAPENILSEDMDEYIVTKDVTFTPWYVDKDKKVVTFYNGTATFETQEIPEGGNATEPATDPTKTGAEFKHWGISDDAETAFDFNTAINADTKLYAVYEYTVSFDGNAYPAQKVLHGKAATNPGDASETGKTFKHWSLTPDGAAYDFGTKVTDSITLYPVFDTNIYEVKFMVNGSPVDTKNVEHGDTVDEPADPTAPAGMKFSHWSITPDGAAYDFATPVNSDLELHAVFVPVTAEKFDVVFKVDGTEVHTEEVTDGGYAAGPATEPEDTDEKYFAGWIVEGDTTETVVDLTTYAITEDTTFVAFFKNKLAVTFYDLSLDDAPLFTAYVMPGETLAENQYPHHEDNLGEGVLDLGEDYEGFERNSGIHSVYDGVNYVHTVPMSYWYLAEDGDTEWTVFDSSVVINEDTDVHLNVQEVTVTIDIPKLSSTFALTMWAPYNSKTRVIDTVKDGLFIGEDTILRGIDTVEDDIMGKLVERDIIDEDYNIKNIHKHITLVQVLGEDNINKYIWEFVGDNASDEDVEKDRQKKAYVNQLVDELCAGGDVTVTEDRLFMFEPIYEKLSKFNYEFIESKIPAQLKKVLPMEHIEKLFSRFYDDAKYGYVSQLKDAMAKAEADPEGTYYVGSGVTIMINPVSDLFAPALEHAIEMKGLPEGKLADKFPVYYSYYKENPYAKALEDYLTTETWFDGSDAGFEGELSGYSLKEFDEYYQIVKALAVLSDDAMLYYYNDVPEADRDAVLDVALTKMLDIANIVKGLLVDYATNGIPESLEDFIKSIEKDPELLKYLEKFGVDAYLDKIAGNANADKVYDTAFDKLMGKFGDRIEALLTKFADSKLNRDYDEGEYNKALEVLNGLFTTEEGEAIYTVDTIFEEFLGGVFFKEISAKGATVSVERDFLTNVDDAK